jgi:ADP-ribosylglycohydrolase
MSSHTLPHDYAERVYAGVLGKLIGVYLGRPFEGWSYERITRKLGEIWYYVHEKLDVPLIVTDDDISGTFTFLRALPDHGNRLDLTPAQIGQTWLNYLIEERTILWWGGLGNSTEHTAYLRLKNGIEAPRSGSIACNSKVVAEQIGAQIFIDGWAMVAPGNPELAADLARRAGSVSHDGEALYGAQVLAAMASLAFVESDLDALFDTAVALIPHDSVIYRMIADIRDWRVAEPDWRKAFARLAVHYGYDKYGGNCHMVPNHGLMMLSLLYGDGDFQKTLMIVNTCGWDTDCNSGNVGCLMGIKNGLAGLDAGPDWRGPMADRLYVPTADGGRAITDAVTEAVYIINVGRALADQPPLAPKKGARYHFEFPGAVQGFMCEQTVASAGVVTVENVAGHSRDGDRSLALHYEHVAPGRVARVSTPTFIPSAEVAAYFEHRGYALLASPTLYAGQTLRARVEADAQNPIAVTCRPYLRVYDSQDDLARVPGPAVVLAPGADHEFVWTVPDTGGYPIAQVGIELTSDQRADGTLYLDTLTWDGAPTLTLTRPEAGGTMWHRAWVDGVDQAAFYAEPYRLIQNSGTGLLIQGTRAWADYRVSADVTPHMVAAAGIAARVQGMRRYYGLLLAAGEGDRPRSARLVKVYEGKETVLAEEELAWAFGETYQLTLEVVGSRLRAWVKSPVRDGAAAGGGDLLFDVEDSADPLTGGAVALLCTEGRTATQCVEVTSAA